VPPLELVDDELLVEEVDEVLELVDEVLDDVLEVVDEDVDEELLDEPAWQRSGCVLEGSAPPGGATQS
jgi:hypothetical protein